MKSTILVGALVALATGLARQELEKLGFKVVSMPGPIEPALKAAHDAVCDGLYAGNVETCVHKI